MAQATDDRDRVFCGTIVHATESCPLEIWENAVLGVKEGKVAFLDSANRLEERLRQHELETECIVRLSPRQFVMPGLVDCHIHSPQLAIQGVGTDRGLLDWLDTYTYPTEALFSDPVFAEEAHNKAVRRTLRGGTTAAAYYSSIHTDTTLLLCRAADELGQRALVGKVNIDSSSPDYYIETTRESLAETERFIDEALSLKSDLVTPIITPRFALSCSQTLLTGLGWLAKDKTLPVQTHLDETLQEIQEVLEAFPSYKTYTDIYDAAGLLGSRTILGHCVHVKDSELALIKERGAGVVHCACSNTTLRSGVMDLRRQLDKGVKVGLGTDVGGGYTYSMLQSMRHAVDVSNICAIQKQQQQQHDECFDQNGPDHVSQHNSRVKNKGDIESKSSGSQSPTAYRPLTMSEAFRLATLGGSTVLGENCGNFEPGREFDGLLIDPEVNDSPLDLFYFDTAEKVVHKFLYTGDDRNIVKVYVQGRQVVNRCD